MHGTVCTVLNIHCSYLYLQWEVKHILLFFSVYIFILYNILWFEYDFSLTDALMRICQMCRSGGMKAD